MCSAPDNRKPSAQFQSLHLPILGISYLAVSDNTINGILLLASFSLFWRFSVLQNHCFLPLCGVLCPVCSPHFPQLFPSLTGFIVLSRGIFMQLITFINWLLSRMVIVIGSWISYLSCAATKRPDKRDLREESDTLGHGLGVQSVLVTGAEVADHRACAVRMQRSWPRLPAPCSF